MGLVVFAEAQLIVDISRIRMIYINRNDSYPDYDKINIHIELDNGETEVYSISSAKMNEAIDVRFAAIAKQIQEEHP